MELLEALLQADAEQVIIFILALVVLYALWRLSKTETKFDAWYEQKLAQKQQENNRLLKRISDLEEKAKLVPILQDQQRILCEQLADLQAWKTKAEPELESNQQEIARLNKTLAQTTSERDRALEQNKWYAAKHETFLAVFQALGVKIPADTNDGVLDETVAKESSAPKPETSDPNTSHGSQSDSAATTQSIEQPK